MNLTAIGNEDVFIKACLLQYLDQAAQKLPGRHDYLAGAVFFLGDPVFSVRSKRIASDLQVGTQIPGVPQFLPFAPWDNIKHLIGRLSTI